MIMDDVHLFKILSYFVSILPVIVTHGLLILSSAFHCNKMHMKFSPICSMFYSTLRYNQIANLGLSQPFSQTSYQVTSGKNTFSASYNITFALVTTTLRLI